MARSPEQKRAYYLAHRDDILAKRAAYRAANREAIRAKKAAEYQANRTKVLAQSAVYRTTRREEARAYAKTYRESHREELRKNAKDYAVKHREASIVYRRANRDILKARNRAHYAANRSKRLRKAQEWIKSHPHEMAEHYRRRRARKVNAPLSDFTSAQWKAMLEHFQYRCQYCPEDCRQCATKTHKLTQDHITPLSRGGAHTLANIVPCCQSCNSKKHAGPVLRPVQPMLL